MKYFSYCPEEGFELHATENSAKAAAQNALDCHRDHSEEGWHDEVSQVSWGKISQIAKPFNFQPPCAAKAIGVLLSSDVDYYCEYKLTEVTQK